MKVGVLGGGQLGQMLMLAAHPLGVPINCFESSRQVPAGIVGEVVAGDVVDAKAVRAWAASVDVVTYEFENFPAALVGDLSERRPVRPGAAALATAQDRWLEKRLFNNLGIPVTQFRLAHSRQDIVDAFEDWESPLIAKTRTGGYDGKGQVVVKSPEDFDLAAGLLDENDVILERFVEFERELSVIGVRSIDGDVAMYPLVENVHRNGILHTSRPFRYVSPTIEQAAHSYMRSLLDHLDYIGVLTLELFYSDKNLVANEMAPRVHNSGHWTIEGAISSQFENHIRAICGLPLGNTDLRELCMMRNLVGNAPDVAAVLAIPGAHLHLYRKSERPGRKLGHVTVTAADEATLEERFRRLETVLEPRLAAGSRP